MPLPSLAPAARRRDRRTLAWWLLPALASLGCGGRPAPGAGAPTPAGAVEALVLEPCAIPGVPGAAHCGVDSVWEDRASRRGRRIGLRVVVLPALDPAPAPDPLVVLAGGPGQGAAELAPLLARDLAALRQRRALVLVDQRGTGASNRLSCPGGMAALADATGAGVRACAAALSARADLRHYTTAEAVDDLDEVRAALGYAQVNLLGVSYGTRVAQRYLQRHPDRVRTVTLRAVAPLGFNIPRDGARAADAALRDVLRACAADAACAAAFPRLATELDTVLARASRAPQRVRVDGADVTIDRFLLAQTLYALLLSGSTRQAVPLLIHRAAADGLERLAPVAAQVSAAAYGSIPVGMYLSVVCAEDVPALSGADRAALARDFGGLSAGLVDACRAWPRGARPARDEPPSWSGPALLVSGEADPATDVAQGAALARAWTGASHVVLPATAHGPMFPGCATDLVARFVDRASGAGLDDACVRALAWPPFATTR